jgi:hypothetical protein
VLAAAGCVGGGCCWPLASLSGTRSRLLVAASSLLTTTSRWSVMRIAAADHWRSPPLLSRRCPLSAVAPRPACARPQRSGNSGTPLQTQACQTRASGPRESTTSADDPLECIGTRGGGGGPVAAAAAVLLPLRRRICGGQSGLPSSLSARTAGSPGVLVRVMLVATLCLGEFHRGSDPFPDGCAGSC